MDKLHAYFPFVSASTKRTGSHHTAVINALILPIIFLSGGIFCSGGPVAGTSAQCRESVAEKDIERVEGGWCGDDTFRWKETGAPHQSMNDKEKRKAAAIKAAVEKAQHAILDRFKGYSIEGAGDYFWDTEPDLPRRRGLQKELKSAIQSGRIIATACDIKENCTIIYEIKRKGLKRSVSETSWR